jgi:hypothetical protein
MPLAVLSSGVPGGLPLKGPVFDHSQRQSRTPDLRIVRSAYFHGLRGLFNLPAVQPRAERPRVRSCCNGHLNLPRAGPGPVSVLGRVLDHLFQVYAGGIADLGPDAARAGSIRAIYLFRTFFDTMPSYQRQAGTHRRTR